jgi:hypothetical protein
MTRGTPEIAAALAFLTGIVALMVATLSRPGRHGLRAAGRPASSCAIGTGLRAFLTPPAGPLPAPGRDGDGAGDRLAPPGGPGTASSGPPGRTGPLGLAPGPRPVPA